MTDGATALAMIGAYKSHVEIENEILALFAPVHQHHGEMPSVGRNEKLMLWRADAIHRAKNLSQLTLALATLAENPSRSWLSTGLVAQTRRLARAYAELGEASGQSVRVPCAPLLVEIATRLALIFGGARHIDVVVEAEPIMLAADTRRALILMCSEMVINALKYAFPGRASGVIRVSLAAQGDAVVLIVEDDGIGPLPGSASGHGHRLLAELGASCGASVVHGAGPDGAGYRVTAQIAVMTAFARQA